MRNRLLVIAALLIGLATLTWFGMVLISQPALADVSAASENTILQSEDTDHLYQVVVIPAGGAAFKKRLISNHI